MRWQPSPPAAQREALRHRLVAPSDSAEEAILALQCAHQSLAADAASYRRLGDHRRLRAQSRRDERRQRGEASAQIEVEDRGMTLLKQEGCWTFWSRLRAPRKSLFSSPQKYPHRSASRKTGAAAVVVAADRRDRPGPRRGTPSIPRAVPLPDPPASRGAPGGSRPPVPPQSGSARLRRT